jgi:hypothetical protein
MTEDPRPDQDKQEIDEDLDAADRSGEQAGEEEGGGADRGSGEEGPTDS